ncbi:MAG: 2,3-bisphosphoglycerate-independent phosphoglycerate mutase [Pseudomonadales bacterium]|nr:2,3-bisphosphoglycerate-independent phosphoglycerate mutase [Pseudomonadales bacterium]
MTAVQKTPTVLIILDGWGHREDPKDNAIANAHTPHWQALQAQHPHTLIATSGMDVGLPEGQMGNSEVGHMSLGAGRIVYQNISRINKAIDDGDFFTNTAYCNAIASAIAANKAVHIIGLLSPGGVHSHQDHIQAMVKMAHDKGAKAIYVHAILDGRDTPPRSAEAYLATLEATCQQNNAQIASVIGRYYAMDRDNRWDRVEKAYNLLTGINAEFSADNAQAALSQAYARDENDEFVGATAIAGGAAITDGDAVLFMNFRADRAREITRAFVDDNFDGFARRNKLALADFVMTTEYAESIKASCAYPPTKLKNVLPQYLADNGKTQLRIAETEKYAHVTFFFSGGREALYKGEERELVPSPDVATYDLQPEMSAHEVSEKLVTAIKSGKFDTIICNFANGDMVGHTGIYEAAIKAVETLDTCIKDLTDAVIEVGGHCLITADHGNCEQMMDYDSGQPHTQHTTELVPLMYVGKLQNVTLAEKGGRLADIAPTILDLMGMDQPAEMTGHSLIIKA